MPVRRPRRFAAPLLLLLATALVFGACTRIVGPRSWTQGAELVGGGSYTIDVRDASGRIDDVVIDPPGVAAPQAVMNPAGQPNVLLVSWTGGACDERTDIAIEPGGPGLVITIETTVADRDCDAIGVAHVLQLTSSQPLPANAVTVASAP